MFSRKRIAAVASVGKYTVEIAGKNAVLTFCRDWQSASGPVITALGAQTLASLAVRGGLTQQSVYSFGDGERPVITVPASLLKATNIRYRIAADGEAMAARIQTQKATRKFEKASARVLRELGLTFGN